MSSISSTDSSLNAGNNNDGVGGTCNNGRPLQQTNAEKQQHRKSHGTSTSSGSVENDINYIMMLSKQPQRLLHNEENDDFAYVVDDEEIALRNNILMAAKIANMETSNENNNNNLRDDVNVGIVEEGGGDNKNIETPATTTTNNMVPIAINFVKQPQAVSSTPKQPTGGVDVVAPSNTILPSFYSPTSRLHKISRGNKGDKGGGQVVGDEEVRTAVSNTSRSLFSPTTPPSNKPSKTQRGAQITKITFFIFLLIIGLITCILLYTWLSKTEVSFAMTQFSFKAQRAVLDSLNVVSRKRLSMTTMSTVISEQFPSYEEDWPNVAVAGYDRIVNMMVQTGSHSNMGFAPIVKREDQQEFEDFAYEYFDSRPDFPPSAGINSFGKGIWRFDKQGDDLVRVHDNNTSTDERQFLTPIFQCCIDNPGDPILLYNLHSEAKRRKTINGIIECTKNIQERVEGDPNVNSTSYPEYSCGSMTEFVPIVRFQTRGPASIMFQPVYPADNPWYISGLILSPIVWDEIFEATFSKNVDGVHAVLTSETESYTYTITDGRVESFQKGDIHETKFDEYGVSVNLTWSDLHSMGAPMYKLSLYPTEEYVKSYSTGNPKVATILALSAILLLAVLFLIYDYFVKSFLMERNQLLEAKRRFIRFVSHEVRTPLNAVMMGLSIIEAEMEAEEGSTERLTLLREVQTSTEHAVEVLNDVLLYDKIESSIKVDISLVNIWHIIERTLSEFKLPAARQDVTLRASYTDNSGVHMNDMNDLPEAVRCLRVAGDASRLAQVFRNLLSNALKFTSEGLGLPEGFVQVTASYHNDNDMEENRVKWKGVNPNSEFEKIVLHNGEEILANPRGYFQLTVKDTGVGMTEDQLSHLFGEGVQFNAARLQAGRGSGLGLFIAKSLVEQHRGTLSASSGGLDLGASFTLKLPLYHVSEIQENSSTDSKRRPTAASSSLCSKKLRILVVDDAFSNRKFLSRLLERNGHYCDKAENGQSALEMVRDTMLGNVEPYDCILMDYEMPVMNGPTSASLIRELGSDVFIIGITGNILRQDVEYFRSRGANAILPKPISMSALENLFVEHQLTY